jgi:hypothetical protein
MMAVDSSILDPPRTTPTADPKAHLQAAANCHVSAQTGSPHCNPPAPVVLERGGSTRAPNRVIGQCRYREQTFSIERLQRH